MDRIKVLTLIRGPLVALHQANETGNYTVLRDLGAPSFQAANTAVKLGELFGWMRARELDLASVAALEPQLTTFPEIDANGILRIAGFFPSVAIQVRFELAFMAVGNRWKLLSLSVGLGQASPAPPQPPKPEATNTVKPGPARP
jgi:hypothetical protein